MKKTHRSALFLAAGLLAAVLVYAWVVDTDGGDNPFVKGTCTYNNNGTNISFTDTCVNASFLREYFPIDTNTSDSCGSRLVYCPGYNYNANNCSHTYTCGQGRCKESVSCKE